MKRSTYKQQCMHGLKNTDAFTVETIPTQSPVFYGQASWKKGRIDGIHCDGLADLSEDLLQNVRSWLAQVLDSWPDTPLE